MAKDEAQRAEREDSINSLNTALQRHANLLHQQGFTFNQLAEDVDEILANVGWPDALTIYRSTSGDTKT